MVEGLFYEAFGLTAKYPGRMEGSPASFFSQLSAEELEGMAIMKGFSAVAVEAHPAYDHETNPQAVNMLIYSFYEQPPAQDTAVSPDVYVLFEETGTSGNGTVAVQGDRVSPDGTLSAQEVEELYFIAATMATVNMPRQTLGRLLGQASAGARLN